MIAMMLILTIGIMTLFDSFFTKDSISKSFLNDTTYVHENPKKLIFLSFYCLFLSYWFHLYNLIFPVIFVAFLCLFAPYLSKRSHLKNKLQNKSIILIEDKNFRKFSDILVYSNIFYFISCTYSMYLKQYYLSLFQFLTLLASSNYHLSSEILFFNFDFICATSLLIIFLESVIDSYNHNLDYFYLAVLSFPVAIFLISYCGMPAEIIEKFKGCCIRKQRTADYSIYHSIWHFVSSLGPILSSYYFSTHRSDTILGYGYIDENNIVPITPFVAITIAVNMNLIGNYLGIMPIE